MKKVSKVELYNFQSHKKTIIDKFGDFNVFLGPTDSGKSAIIRAIKWCLYNYPDGNEFIRQGESFAEVTVHFNDGTAIKRRKSKKENRYELFKDNESVLILESFGQGPVQEVVNFHGMREVDFFGRKQSLNICDQLSMPFFIANSPIERASMIGQLGKTDIIDRAVRNVVSETREKKSELKSYKEQLEEKNEDLKSYSNLPIAEINLQKMEECIDVISSKIKAVEELSSLKEKIVNTELKCLKMSEITKFKDEVNTAITGVENLVILNSKLVQLSNNRAALFVNMKRKEDLDKIIGQVSINDIDNSIAGIEMLIDKIRLSCNVENLKNKITFQRKRVAEAKDKAESLKGKSKEVDNAINSIEIQQGKLTDYMRMQNKIVNIKENIERKKKGEAMIEDLKTKYNLAFTMYEKALVDSKTCPFCMSEISADKLEVIKSVI